MKLKFLEDICWQTDDVYRFNEEGRLARYERGWSYITLFDPPNGEEMLYIRNLAFKYQSWLMVDYHIQKCTIKTPTKFTLVGVDKPIKAR